MTLYNDEPQKLAGLYKAIVMSPSNYMTFIDMATRMENTSETFKDTVQRIKVVMDRTKDLDELVNDETEEGKFLYKMYKFHKKKEPWS